MKYLHLFLLLLVVLGAVMANPLAVSAQVTKACNTDADCSGPGAVCAPNPLGYYPNGYSGPKNCRNYFCDATKPASVRVVDAAGNPTGSTSLKKGQFLEVTLTSKYDADSFSAAMYNRGNLYPAPPENNPKPIHVPKSHMDKFNMTSNLQSDGNYHLVWSEKPGLRKSHTMRIPFDFFVVKDQNKNSANQVLDQVASNIQINGYFGQGSYFSMPEGPCVTNFTLDLSTITCTTDAECTQPNSYCKDGSCVPRTTVTSAPVSPTTKPQGNCPAGSSCGANNVCACNAGRYNCDNNWANGCEASAKCLAGQVCTDNADCASGVCKDRICQGGSPVQADGRYCKVDADCGIGGKCFNGACSCNGSSFNCDGINSNGCEAGSNTCGNPTGGSENPGGYCKSDANCGANAVCSTTGLCACKAGYYNCDGNPDNGCESMNACTGPAPTKVPAGYCTADNQCKANQVCSGNACVCKSGFYDCDGIATNGCESTTACSKGNATLEIRLKFNGIGANIPPIKDTVKTKVILYTKAMEKPVEKEAEFKIYANSAGMQAQGIRLFRATIDVSDIPISGGYSVFIKGGYHIQKRICDNTPTETTGGRYYCKSGNISIKEGVNVLDFTGVYQLAGDLPLSEQQSGFVDSLDITFLRANLGSTDATKVAIGDLNFDGIVDTQDYALGIYSLSFKYDEEIAGEELR